MKKIFVWVVLGVLFVQTTSFACGMKGKDHADGGEAVEATQKA